MDIRLLKKIAKKPKLYEKGTSVMWTDPHISKQLLQYHINPDNDLASRSQEKILRITTWILKKTQKSPMKILDLGCGPGLYAELFAQKGHAVTGIDFSTNSIQYATKQAKTKKLNIEYINKSYLELDFNDQFDLVILIYCDFCALVPKERDTVLEVIYKALKKDGLFICDVVNEKNIDKKIIPQSWEIQKSGFWKNTPYIALTSGYHYPEAKVFANHHVVIGENDKVDAYIFWNHYYGKNDLVPMLESKGFTEIETYDNIVPGNDCWSGENITFYTAKKH